MLYIDPEQCLDCGACLPECPVEAIYPEHEVPSKWVHFVELNRERTAALLAANEGPLTEKQEPKEGAGCTKAK